MFLLAFLAALFTSSLVTWVVRNLACKYGWLSTAASQRHIHRSPVPRLGGVAVFITLVTVVGLTFAWAKFRNTHVNFSWHALLFILAPAGIVFLLGLLDDIKSVGPYTKFSVQAIAASVLFLGGIRIGNSTLILGGQQFGLWPALGLTVLWMLWISNAFNLIDGLDGLAAGSALFSTLVLLLVALLQGNQMMLLITTALAGTLLGFLRYNFNPATIFLGDCGSLFIGFLLGAVSITGSKGPAAVAVAIPIIAFGLPVLDTALAVLRRFISGRPLFSADREHIHHKLLDLGLSHRQAVLALYAVSAAGGLLSLFLLQPNARNIGILLLVLGTGVVLFVQHLGYHELSELRRVANRAIVQKKVMANNVSVRRLRQVLEHANSFGEICDSLESAFHGNAFERFELEFHPRRSASAFHYAPLVKSNGSGYSFGWSTRQHSTGKQWSISLPLLAADGIRVGSFSVEGVYSRELLFDINLLTSGDFHHVLANALDRAAQMPAINATHAGIAAVAASSEMS